MLQIHMKCIESFLFTAEMCITQNLQLIGVGAREPYVDKHNLPNLELKLLVPIEFARLIFSDILFLQTLPTRDLLFGASHYHKQKKTFA